MQCYISMKIEINGRLIVVVLFISIVDIRFFVLSVSACLFHNLGAFVSQECRCAEYSGTVGSDERSRVDTAYRIVADHVRMMTVAITDGLVPSRRESG